MRNLFNYDSPLMTGLAKFYRLILADALWIVFSIPVFTAGASLTAFYYTIQTNLKYNRGYVWTCFWDSFKSNLRLALRLWLIFLGVGAVLLTDLGMLRYLREAGHSTFGLEVLLGVLGAIALTYAVWTFAYVARFENTARNTLRNAAMLAVLNPGRSLVILALAAAGAMVVYVLPISVLLVPGACLWFASVLIEGVFRANMTEEQRRQEDERNRQTQGGE